MQTSRLLTALTISIFTFCVLSPNSAHAKSIISKCVAALALTIEEAGIFPSPRAKRDILEGLFLNEFAAGEEYQINFSKTDTPAMIEELLSEPLKATFAMSEYFSRRVRISREFNLADIRTMRDIKEHMRREGLTDVFFATYQEADIKSADKLYSLAFYYRWLDQIFLSNRATEEVKSEITSLAAMGRENANLLDRTVQAFCKRADPLMHLTQQPICGDVYENVLAWLKTKNPKPGVISPELMKLYQIVSKDSERKLQIELNSLDKAIESYSSLP